MQSFLLMRGFSGLTILSLIILFVTQAQAGLGEKSQFIEKERVRFNGKMKMRPLPIESCYSVKEIESEGVHITEYINNATDTVFMVFSMSRYMVDNQKFLSTDLVSEYESVPTKQLFSRHVSKVSGESAKISYRTEKAGGVHRSLIILKSSVPSCVSNPESLL